MRKAFPSLLFFAASSILMARADDLVTRDGTVYHNYKVLSHDAGFITILDSDGGGKIPLSNLPDALQKQYGYNKQEADAAVQAAIAQDRQDRQAIALEQARRQQQLAAQAQAEAQAQTQTVAATDSQPGAQPNSQTPAPVPGSGPIAPVAAVSIQPTSAAQPAPSKANAPSGDKSDFSPAGVLTQDQIDAIKQKISDLRDDIALQRREIEHEQSGDQAGTTHGAAAQIMEDDQSKMEDLNQQLEDSNRAARRAQASASAN